MVEKIKRGIVVGENSRCARVASELEFQINRTGQILLTCYEQTPAPASLKDYDFLICFDEDVLTSCLGLARNIILLAYNDLLPNSSREALTLRETLVKVGATSDTDAKRIDIQGTHGVSTVYPLTLKPIHSIEAGANIANEAQTISFLSALARTIIAL